MNPRKVILLTVTDSLTGTTEVRATWKGEPMRLWVHLADPVEYFILDQDSDPEPKEGWSYAMGFFR